MKETAYKQSSSEDVPGFFLKRMETPPTGTVERTVYVADNKKIMYQLNNIISEYQFKYSPIAINNLIDIFHLAIVQNISVKRVKDMNDEDGIFIDLTGGESYYGIEIYNDGDILLTKKKNSQPSEVKEIETIDSNIFS